VIDKRNKGEISRANFDKIAKMCGFVGPQAENKATEAKFEELIKAHTYQPLSGGI
jgi:Ca2+-binding EF-hand superfamily protein